MNNNPFIKTTENTWCPGCGNFSILDALVETLHEEQLTPEQVLLVSGIGQAAKIPHYVNSNGINALHGRALPSAMGAHIANPDLKIIIHTGDGDAFAEGGNHFIHALRRNLDVLHLVHDNQVYGLTKGQGSPTAPLGQKTTLQIEGMRSDALNPVALAISLGASFVARGFSGDKAQLKALMKEGLNHKGYAFIDVLQPCISFNKINTYAWYKDRVKPLPEGYDPYDKLQAFKLSEQYGDDGIPVGIIYLNEKSTFMDRNAHMKTSLLNTPRDPQDIAKLMQKLTV